MAKDLDIRNIMVFYDFQLVLNQKTTAFEAREPRMASYLQIAKDLLSCCDSFEISHVLWEANLEADRLARISLGIDKDSTCLVVSLLHLSIDGSLVNTLEEGKTWMTPIIKYLVNRELFPDKNEA